MSSIERIAAAVVSAERIRDLQHERGISKEEAIKSHFLEEYELQICGHDTMDLKSNKEDIIGDALLRAQNLERLYRGFLFSEKNKDDDGNILVDTTAQPHEDELISMNDYKRNYEMIRRRHNEMFAKGEGETKTIIPEYDQRKAREFMAGQVRGGWLELVPASRSIGDVELRKMEDEKMFRFPPTEFHRQPGEVEKEKKVLKQAAFSLLLNERKARVHISGKIEDGLFSAFDLMDVYTGLADNSQYKGEMGLYLTFTSAQAFIREQMDHYGLEEIVVRREFVVDGETHVVEENFYRQIPSEQR
jgi:hypothetical protein